MDPDIHFQVYQRQWDIFHQKAFADIRKADSKLRTYSKFKTEPGFEKYLDDVRHVKEQIALTKLRLKKGGT